MMIDAKRRMITTKIKYLFLFISAVLRAVTVLYHNPSDSAIHPCVLEQNVENSKEPIFLSMRSTDFMLLKEFKRTMAEANNSTLIHALWPLRYDLLLMFLF